MRRQLTAEKKQHAAADKTVSGLRLEAARSSASSEQVSALTAENEALKSDYASALQARVQQSYQIEELKGEIRPLYLDPLAWLVLAAGLGVGALVGLRVGFRRGENRYLP